MDGVDGPSDDGSSGWSINLSGLDLSEESLECEVWGGALGCDTSADTAELLGLATITCTSVTWYIKSEYASVGYELYVGSCPMSDGGATANEGAEECSVTVPYNVNTYPLVSSELPLEPPNTLWTFDLENQVEYTTWTEYQVFDICENFGDTVYLSGHAEICPCVTESPTSAPFGEEGTAEPTKSPTKEPTDAPTPGPTPSPTESPTKSPTPSPTDSPTKSPTPSPTDSPTKSPTPSPTESPTKSPTPSPTKSPTPAPTEHNCPTPKPVYEAVGTDEPTDSPTKSPTEDHDCPTPEPTKEPDYIEEGTPEPTESPTDDHDCPTPEPTKEPDYIEEGDHDCPTPEPTKEPDYIEEGTPPEPTEAPYACPPSHHAPTSEPTPAPAPADDHDCPTPKPSFVFVPEGSDDEPTKPPTEAPTRLTMGMMRTDAPLRTEAPFSEAGGTCQDAYVYCPGRSTCFTDPIFNCFSETEGEDPWGWNIVYSSDDGVVEDCEIWIGAHDCSFDGDEAEQIGTATIVRNSFTLTLDSQEYGSGDYTFEYNFYVGECIGSDGGNHIENDICLADDVSEWARRPETYPLTSGNLSVNTYTFTEQNEPRTEWGAHYPTFPIGSRDRKYLSAQVEICS